MSDQPEERNASNASGKPQDERASPTSVDEVIADYMQRVDAGERPDPEAIVAANPNIADELRDFFADLAVWDISTQMAPETTAEVKRDQSIRYFGDYDLLSEIARGGMGVVYRARQRSLDRIVAVKLILSGALASDREVDRFHEEARAAAQLVHQSIVRILEIGKHEDRHYYTMEFVSGGSLADRLATRPLAARDAASLIRQIAAAVEYAHQHNVLHRDIKPANILLSDEGLPLLSDFGLAKRLNADIELTQTGELVGTPSYMAPEQAVPGMKCVGVWTDVYSLGAVLYSLLTGRPPVNARTPHLALAALMSEDPPLPRSVSSRVPRDLETICMKCLEKKPKDRYASAEELADELERFLKGIPIRARPVGLPARTARWVRRKPLAAIVIFACFLLACSAPLLRHYVSSLQSRLSEQENDREIAERAADKQSQRAARISYAKDLHEAYAAWRDGEADRARTLLELQRPLECQVDQRDFAWFYLYRVAHAFYHEFDFEAGVNKFKLSSDASRLAVQEGPYRFKLLDTVTGKLIKEIETQPNSDSTIGTDLSFSPDGTILAILMPSETPDDGEAQQLTLLNAKNGVASQLLSIPNTEQFTAIVFSPDGRSLGCHKSYGRISVWSVDDGTLKSDLTVGDSSLADIAFSPFDAKLAALVGTESDTLILRVWDVATGTVEHESTLDGNLGLADLAYSPSGKHLAVRLLDRYGPPNSYARVWSVPDWKVVGQIDNTPTNVFFSQDSTRLAIEELSATGRSTGSLAVQLWSLDPFHHLREVVRTEKRGRCFGFSRYDETLFITQGVPLSSHQLCEVDIEARQILARHNVNALFELAPLPDEGTLVADIATPGLLGMVAGTTSRQIRLKRFGQQEKISTAQIFSDSIESLSFTAGSDKLITTREAECAIFDLKSQSSTRFPMQGRSVARIDGNRLVYISPIGKPALLDLNNNTSIPLDTNGNTVATFGEWQGVWGAADGSVVLAAIDGELYRGVVDASSLILMERLANFGPNVQLALSNDATHVALKSGAPTLLKSVVTIRSGVSGNRLGRLATDDGFIGAMAFSHDNTRLYTLQSFASTVTVWDLDKLDRVSAFGESKGLSALGGMAESPDGRVLATYGSAADIRLWDLQTGTELGFLEPQGIVTCLTFSPNGSVLAAARADGSVKLWHTDLQASAR